VGHHVDFSKNADVYDRRHGATVDDGLARRLTSLAALRPGARVVDVGAGTGRVAIPLAEMGLTVTALDPAASMLEKLRAKARDLPMNIAVAVGGLLPLRAAQFDAAIIARLLYVVPEWRELVAELSRVLVPNGYILHEWGNGDADEEWVQIREEARRRFEAAGVPHPFHPGARTDTEVAEALYTLGFRRVDELREPGDVERTLAEFLRMIVDGECSYTWNIPTPVRRVVLPELAAWAVDRFDLTRPVVMPREIRWTLYARGNRVQASPLAGNASR